MKSKMLLPITLILMALTSTAFPEGQSTHSTLADEAKKAFVYLNLIRSHPAKYTKEIGIDLSDVQKRQPLHWNDKLARSAQKKAEDMAARDYLGHHTPEGEGPGVFIEREGYYLPLDWPDASDQNYVESVSGGSSRSGIEHIQNLLYDHGVPHSSTKANHRKHLLGMNKFWAGHVDIGIGFAYNPDSKYKGYFVVHTASPGQPSVTISGRIYAPAQKKSRIQVKDLWVGTYDKQGKKYWTKVTLDKGKKYVDYRFKVPQGAAVIVRYFKQYSDETYLRGYYTPTATVTSPSGLTWMAVTNEDISGLDMTLLLEKQ